MKKKATFYTLFIVLLIITAVGLYALIEYNRKSIDLTNTKAAYMLSAKEIIQEFAISDTASNSKYLSQIISITGKVQSIDSANKYALTIVLAEPDQQTSIRCSMDSTVYLLYTMPKAGMDVTIKGIYTGYNADDLGLGADIILNKCILIKE